MDCGALAAQQQQQQLLQQHQQLLQQQQQLQHSRQQKQQHTLNCLEETATTNISQLASQGIIVGGAASEGSETTAGVGAGAGAGGSPQHKLLGIGEPSLSGAGAVKLRKHNDQRQTSSTSTTTTTSTTDVAVGAKSHASYRISMANLEDTQESELDLILGELSLLEAQITYGEASFLPGVVAAAAAAAASANQQSGGPPPPPALASVSVSAASSRTHSRTNSSISADVSTASSSSGISENGVNGMAMGHSNVVVGITGMPGMGMGTAAVAPPTGGHNMTMGITLGVVTPREPRTESPDNDSAFSDTVSLLSSESSASSNTSTQQQQQQQQLQLQQKLLQQQQHHHQTVTAGGNVGISKAAKIQLALHKLESASIRRLFVKAFTADGASKSLLVDERMVCGHVTRLLADKNHVQMQPTWALIEHLGDLQMERLFEDHELLVDNLMTWNSDAGNRVLFQQRPDKLSLFAKPELYLPGPQMAPGCQHDDQTRYMLLEEFFETHAQLQLEGPLYMKADPKKGWKRHHFVLRSSGLYYFPKEKTKNTRDLLCLTLFSGHNVYTGIGWRKKWKSPTDHTFGFKSAVDSSLGKSCRSLKMLCAEDAATLERWLTAIRICKYGKQLWHNHKLLMEELTAGGGGGGVGATSGGISGMAGSFAASMRSESISSISSAVPSQCGSVSSAISSMSNSSGRISRASSSSSSGCLSDENNAFDSEFTTGTIKRKPSMKPNLPLTTMTRQLKEVGEITTGPVASSAAASAVDSAASPERSGTLTRRHSRRKSQESNGSSGGTLKRRPVVVVPAVVKREVSASDNGSQSGGGNGGGGNSSSSSNSTPTPTPSICAKPPPGLTDVELMCSSTLSLDSLPPPPPPPALHADEQDVYGSQLSLASLPPPPPPEDVLAYGEQPSTPLTPTPMSMGMGMGMGMPHPLSMANSNGTLPPAVPAKPIKPAVKQTLKAAPPYKAPPDYVGPAATVGGAGATVGTPTATTQHQQQQQQQQQLPPPPAPVQKKVSFADSPVLLRRKMCSPEPQLPQRSPSTTLSSGSSSCSYHQPQPQPIYSPGPLLPPRSDLSRLSNGSDVMSATTSPKRLQESASNPPRDFLKDLQRVMRKKWQVAQKCKLEPATTPHEVLGFRDFNNDDLLAAHNLNSGANSSHYYRETANVSHWVQEHCEYAHNDYALYENVHAQNGNGNGATAVGGVVMTTITTTDGPPPVPPPAAVADATAALRKKRPPPPPPKRSDSTHLTHRV
ncbi:ras-associated and pleckstrin homology domains-containing protein 1 isoform X1 [Drosophila nasuta]|uniref:ras-associated and pleckstrin homology domains-containing protein 1 isoform X1 n=2 Tax=Drosophila nasuta TaxID=42062 RepID=UPI00295E53D9|nr:ras-associated and pleckstrin homology domains-containing protein 1 isoform X1 [Drosophila nasuta]